MKLLIFNGPSCSGKSTIIKSILDEKDNCFKLSNDSFKWLFSKYQSGSHYDDIQKIVSSVAETIFNLKYDVLYDGAIYKTSREHIIDLAKKHGYKIVEINLEADYEVLMERFEKRLTESLVNPGKRMANRSKDKFKELYDLFEKDKNPSAITFKTDNQTEKEVLEAVTKLL